MASFAPNRPALAGVAKLAGASPITRRSTGTLLWIGERQRPEFSSVFENCEARVAQLGLRQSIGDAIERPASDVACIVVTRETRTTPPLADLEILQSLYPGATMIQILGSLCEGERPRVNGPFQDHTLYWHQCNQFLPNWLEDCGVTRAQTQAAANSVAVVASTIQIADPLMELAACCGAAAFWCREPNTMVARNFDAIWWDDSIATPVSTRQWNSRITAMTSRTNKPADHAWIVSHPRIQAVSAAKQAGISLILSKPANIDTLLQTITPVSQWTENASTLRAAA